jgi:hypothetical protein
VEPTIVLTGTRGNVTVTIRLYGPVSVKRHDAEKAVLARRLEQLS